MFFVGVSLNFINSCKSSFTKFFDWFIEFMKSNLIENFGKIFNPYFDHIFFADQELDGWKVLL